MIKHNKSICMMFEEKDQPDHLLNMTSLGYALSVKLWDKIKKIIWVKMFRLI